MQERPVAFIEHDQAVRTNAAEVRRQDETEMRVVSLWKLAHDRLESLVRQDASLPDADKALRVIGTGLTDEGVVLIVRDVD